MDDALSDLHRALLRAASEIRASKGRKKKRPKKPGSPAKTGPGKGCGTGAGGFKAGNNCAKEDGIPQPASALKPVNKKADIAYAKAMKEKAAKKQAAKIAADKARAEAYRPIKEAKAAAKSKQKRIEKLRKAAAERKAEKGERDAAEMKAAAEAAAAKRAAMLQKIRVKKANERIQVVGTPKSIKQEIDELKARIASDKLKVVETPKSIREELDDLKKLTAAKAASSAAAKTAGQDNASPITAGAPLEKNSNALTPQERALDALAMEEDRRKLFGKHLEDAWQYNNWGSVAENMRRQQKISISLSAAKKLEAAGIKESDIDEGILRLLGSRYYGSDKARQLLKDSGVPDEYAKRYALSAGMVDSWAGTSGDHNRVAVGIQYAIKDEFQVSKPYTKHLRSLNKSKDGIEEWDDTINRIRKDKSVRKVLRAHYDATQEHLKREGISEVVLVRGYQSAAKVSDSGSQNVSLQPASSFTMHKGIAERFAAEGSAAKKRHLTARVRASRILSLCTTGFGCMNEQEIVVLGGVISGKVRKNAKDW